MKGLESLKEAFNFLIEILIDIFKLNKELPFHADEETAIKLFLQSDNIFFIILGIIATIAFIIGLYKKLFK